MPRSAAFAVENNFSKGLITEATGLNFPENACTDTSDCIFYRTGEVYSRLGIDLETDYVLNDIGDLTGLAIKEYTWRGVAQNGAITFLALQIGSLIYFYTVDTSGNISANKKSFIVNLEDFKATGSPDIVDTSVSMASGNGKLIVTHPYCDPFIIEYDENADDISTSTIDIKLRDLDGVEDNLEDDERPTVLSTEHEYNLRNQGWYNTELKVTDTTAISNYNQIHTSAPLDYKSFWTMDVIAAWQDSADRAHPPLLPDSQFSPARTDYPSNCDVWWLYRSGVAIDKSFDRSLIGSIDPGNTPAPKGHYILDVFRQDRSSVSGVSGLDIVTSGYQRPSQVAFYAGRAFYAGINSLDFATRIYFSKIIEKTEDFGKCYQQADPTSENISDLLSSDGGVIVIPDIATIVKLFNLGDSLYIFATNGIWRITGSQGIGFSANDFSVGKVSTTGALSSTSFVDVEGSPFWWNSDGIWTLQQQSPITQPNVVSITIGTIQSYYDDIPTSSKYYAKAAYNPLTRIVQWLWREADVEAFQDNYHYDHILNLDLNTNSFYPWTITTADAYIAGIISIVGNTTQIQTQNVIDDITGNTVIDNSGNDVVVTATVKADTSTLLKYVTIYINDAVSNLTFSEVKDPDYVDWASIGNTSGYTSYLVGGFKVHGEAIRKFQPNYMQIWARVPSQFEVYAKWDYSNSQDTSRWSSVQQVQLVNTNYAYASKRLKVRGNGKAVQFKISAITGEPFNLIGWTTFETGNQGI